MTILKIVVMLRWKNLFLYPESHPIKREQYQKHLIDLRIVSDIIFLLVAVFLAFWPYYAGYHDTPLEQSILRSSLNYGTMFYESAIVSLTLLVPLVFDVILEVAHGQSEQRRAPGGSVQSVLSSQSPSVAGKALLEVREKILIYAGFASTPLLIFVHKEYPNFAMLWFCTTRFQLMAVYGSVWVSFCRLDNTAWPSW